MKIYQIVQASDGARSPVFSAESFEKLAEVLAPRVAANPEFGANYVLVLVEDAEGAAYPSRAPMMRVDSVVSAFTKEPLNHE